MLRCSISKYFPQGHLPQGSSYQGAERNPVTTALFSHRLPHPTSNEVKVVATQSCPTLLPHGLQPARLLCPQNSPGKNSGVGCHFPLQGIIPTPALNPLLSHCGQILYCLIYYRTSNWLSQISSRNLSSSSCLLP